MIALDTNVLLRFLLKDDATQSPKARHLILTHCSLDAPGLVTLTVLCEMIWVLQRGYKHNKNQLIYIINQLLQTEEIQIESSSLVIVALEDYRNGTGDFPDYLIARIAAAKGAQPLYTFDRKAASGHPLIQLVP